MARMIRDDVPEATIVTPHLTLYIGHVIDRLREIPAESIDCVVTSPPYWGLRAYGTEPQVWGGKPSCGHVWQMQPARRRRTANDSTTPQQHRNRGSIHDLPETPLCTRCGAWRGELGLEPTPELFVDHMVEVFREVRRVMRLHGTLWLNLGDSFIASAKGPNGDDKSGLTASGVRHQRQRPLNVRKRPTATLKPKDMAGMPWRVALALQADGWWLRSDIIWSKPNPMPESVEDRPTRSHEYVFLLTKARTYFYDAEAIREDFAESTMARLAQTSFLDQTGGPKDYGPDSNRSARGAIENLHAKLIMPGIGPKHGGIRERGEKYEPMVVDLMPKSQGREEQELRIAERMGHEPGWRERLQPIGRNARSVWTIPTQPYPEAHFATFPEELPRRCIAAGAPLEICGTCGKPRERVVVASGGTIGESWHNHEDDLGRGQRGGDDGTNKAAAAYPTYDRTTQGFTDCGHENYRPGVVFDPFAGSGTTLAVANSLGRDAVGVELHIDYVDLIRGRCEALQVAEWNAGAPISGEAADALPVPLDASKGHASLLDLIPD